MTTILHGNIIHAPSFGALETVLNGQPVDPRDYLK